MARIRITKQFSFEMAHSLFNYDGPCKNIHGHSYKLDVTVIGEPISDENNPNLGMVMDFKELKYIVNKNIINKLDHALIINKKSDHSRLIETKKIITKNEIVNYQPTCEMLLIDFSERIIKDLPSDVILHSIKLRETNNSYAEWFASDNNQD
ncbi:6-pyruvoyl tetrahydropterin synthase family protein [Bacteroidota bacterium]